MAEVAAVGWAISTLGWIMSPIVTRVLNEGFDESEKLRHLAEALHPRLALLLEQAERIPPGRRVRLEQWAAKLRSAFYDAEDILDVADYYRLQKQVISHSHIEFKLDMRNIFGRKTSKLKKSLMKLEEIIENGSQLLPLLARTSSSNVTCTSNPTGEIARIVTTSSPLAPVVIGRDEERDKIIRILLETSVNDEPSSSNSKCYSVIGIHGVAGSGKTTLAQHVCSYEGLEDHFSPIMWIDVSQRVSVSKIYQEMLEAATGDPPPEFNNLDTLQKKLEAQLRDKRFFLVLDDIWTDKNVSVQKLYQLLSPLKVGKRGSKILVTTRFADAALSLGAQSLIPIPDLKENDFFDLFMYYALDGASLDVRELEEFQMIGREIAKKLKGSPLAATIVAARLRKQLAANSWRRVRDQNMFNDAMEALWWSYQHLDEQVRRCFAYCSVFPRRHWFERNKLINLWMAEGFIKTANATEQIEDVGRSYFDELVSCSFLQTREIDEDSDSEWFIMHDLLHELAGMVAGSDCFQVDEAEIKDFPSDTRHLYIDTCDPMKITEQICKMRKLRTLIISIDGPGITEQALEAILNKLRKLRVVQVYIKGEGMIPGSICHLKHLRCLSIYKRKRAVVDLPSKFDKLYHLLILEFDEPCDLNCSNVKNMHNLISLRHFSNSLGIPFSHSEPFLEFPSIGRLNSLQTLGHFSVKKEKGYELQQLERLYNLRGSLKISGLENVESKERSLEAKLVEKKYITELSLMWAADHTCPLDLEADILEGLQPPSQLAELKISCYYGFKCPSWLSSNQNRLKNLQYLELECCRQMEVLPEISEVLIHLHVLELKILPKLKKLPKLPDSLKRLVIFTCEALVVTCVEDVEKIISMFMEQACRIDPSFNITHPEEINRFASEQSERSIGILGEIVSNISGSMLWSIMPFICGQIKQEAYSSLLLPASLEHLSMAGCTVTDTILRNCLRGSSSLRSLKLARIPFFTRVPSEMMKTARLKKLYIADCFHFTLIEDLNEIDGLENLHLTIKRCPKLTNFPEDKKPRVLHTLTIDGIPLVPQILSREACAYLTTLQIQDSNERREEENLLQLTSLANLSLCYCNWNSLPENLVSLTSLRLLSLVACKNIQSLPVLPTSLRSFQVSYCHRLFMESCQKSGDPNWQKISHIPDRRFYEQ
ncbi:unnamed protein product [Urochloa decumbens]|uniref:AAA+ ATPase domain-containing protein n=1 Tax=Urochloa decumbens TaxID=240449 RepID=A0ABC9CZR2_9POAL